MANRFKNAYNALIARSAPESAETPTAEPLPVLTPEFLLGATLDQAHLNLSTVWACVRVLSDAAAILPLGLYQKTAKGREVVTKHHTSKLLKAPNDYLSRFDLIHHLMVSVALWGNGYARIFRDKNYRPVRIKLLKPSEVEPVIDDNDDSLHYRLTKSGKLLGPDEIIHIKNLSTNGVKGRSPIRVHRENLQLAKVAQEYGLKYFTQGGNTEGVIDCPWQMTTSEYADLKTKLQSSMAGMDNAHKIMILENGMKYSRINIPLEDAQFIATRKFQCAEIARIFGVPPHMVGDLERATNNNIEHQGIEFVTYCLMPYLVRMEQEFNRKLLRENEQSSLYLQFNLKGLLRGDAKTRSEYYKNLQQVGAINANEVRELEDMNTYQGGEHYFVPMNMNTVEQALQPKQSTTPTNQRNNE